MTTANVLTGMIPTLYEALNRVSREMVGFIPAVTRNTSADRAALNQVVTVPIGVSGALEDITPGQLPADTGNTTVGTASVTITKSKAAPVVWNGEQRLAVNSSGTYNAVLADQFEDGMRKLVNAIELDLAAIAIASASRGFGTQGTTPLGTAGDLSALAGVAQILDDNGAPTSNRQIVFNSATMANLRGKQSVLFKVNEAGSSDMLRNGYTDLLQNMAVRYSAGLKLHTAGTGASYLINNASQALGSTSLTLDTGSGTILVGDAVTVNADTNIYMVNSALASGALGIGNPGLLKAAADNAAVTVGAAYTPNVAFSRNAIVLACRAPALPEGGDAAIDRMMITDTFSGLAFEISVYKQYRQVKYEIAMAWGVAGIKSEHVAVLFG